MSKRVAKKHLCVRRNGLGRMLGCLTCRCLHSSAAFQRTEKSKCSKIQLSSSTCKSILRIIKARTTGVIQKTSDFQQRSIQQEVNHIDGLSVEA